MIPDKSGSEPRNGTRHGDKQKLVIWIIGTVTGLVSFSPVTVLYHSIQCFIRPQSAGKPYWAFYVLLFVSLY